MSDSAIRIGDVEFDVYAYDQRHDVLYLSVGEPREATETVATPEGHEIRFDEDGGVLGVTLVNAKWLLERDGSIGITFPSRRVGARRDNLEPALA